VLGRQITGYALNPGIVAVTDSVVQAFGKVAGNCGTNRNVNVVSEVTTSDDRNVAGLASALALAIDLRTSIATHMQSVGAGAHAIADPYSWEQIGADATVDGTAGGIITVLGAPTLLVDQKVWVGNVPPVAVQPVTGYIASIDDTSIPGSAIYHVTVAAGGLGGDVDLSAFTVALGARIFSSADDTELADPIDLATLLTFTDALRQGYILHDDDSELGAAWLYHINQEAGDHSINPALALTTLAEAIIVLNAFQTAYNAHVADITTHTAADGTSAAAAAANGNAVTVVDAASLAGDKVQWAVLNGGAGPKVGVSAVAGTGIVTFTFNAPPVSDTVISYSLFRAN
jgi:hypothetical protein